MDSYYQDPCYYNQWLGIDQPDGHRESKLTQTGCSSFQGHTNTQSIQPMDRYLQEAQFPTIMSVETDLTIRPISTVPDTSYLRNVSSDTSRSAMSGDFPSPSSSGYSSSQFDSTWSDWQRTPWSSPEMSAAAYSSEAFWNDQRAYNCDATIGYCAPGSTCVDQCVAMYDVQQCADTLPEPVAFDDEHTDCMMFPHDGYQPMHQQAESIGSPAFAADYPNDGLSIKDNIAGQKLSIARRKQIPQTTRAVTSPHEQSKIVKRPASVKRPSSYQSKSLDSQTASNRCFPCPLSPYGCTSTFASKNEWKRHVSTQHVRLGYWHCTQCPEADYRPNDFNRKDLFVQHARRMHPVIIETAKHSSNNKTSSRGRATKSSKTDAAEQILAKTVQQSYRKLRAPPERSGCVLCDAVFVGSQTWEERMEHVGKHLEVMRKDGTQNVEWRDDAATEEYLVREGILVRKGEGLVLA